MMLAKSLQSAAGNAAGEANYIEDVFSTYLYTGNGSTQTITNGIDLAGEGGLVWGKSRTAADDHKWYDTNRGVGKYLMSSATNAQITDATSLTAFNADGFSLGSSSANNFNGRVYVSWTFRKQPKFFDVVTYTGTAYGEQVISHNLESAPGMIIVKRTDSTGNWTCYHRSLGATKYMYLNTTGDAYTSSTRWNDTEPTSTHFTVGSDLSSGGTYVAYLFAHNAGGFGESGEDNVISCGSLTTDALGVATVNLGWEPQFVLFKVSNTTGSWGIKDNMRGMVVDPAPSETPVLYANLSDAESQDSSIQLTSTGFKTELAGSRPYIYIAIRRGPMKVPESGTSVFSPFEGTTGGFVAGFPVDMYIAGYQPGGEVGYPVVSDRLRGADKTLSTSSSAAEGIGNMSSNFDNMTFVGPTDNQADKIAWMFRRAPGFFDEVCYTGGGSTTYIYNHNLGVAPELIITKNRSTNANASYWAVKARPFIGQKALALNDASEDPISTTYWPTTADTATQFRVKASSIAYDSNATGTTYVAYLFASCPGVSKVGSYTGTGTTQQINCGFTTGARFVLIKRTDSSGSWYVWDTARGIVSGNDPYLLLNTTAAEVTSTDYIDPVSSGFEISSTAPAAINASGGTFIFLAIA